MAVVFPEKLLDYEWLLHYNACISLCSGDYRTGPRGPAAQMSGAKRSRHDVRRDEGKTTFWVRLRIGLKIKNKNISLCFSLTFPDIFSVTLKLSLFALPREPVPSSSPLNILKSHGNKSLVARRGSSPAGVHIILHVWDNWLPSHMDIW